jgi:hypothetical protein
MDAYGVLIICLIAPGIPGGLFTSWLVDKIRKDRPATGLMEEAFFYIFVWAVIFWISLAGFLLWKFMF